MALEPLDNCTEKIETGPYLLSENQLKDLKVKAKN